MDYKYLGDKLTRTDLKGQSCYAVRRKDGKCIRGKNSNMLVEFDNGERVIVLARLLRKLKYEPCKCRKGLCECYISDRCKFRKGIV